MTSNVLLTSKPSPFGASLFVAATSCALVASPIWAPLSLLYAGSERARSLYRFLRGTEHEVSQSAAVKDRASELRKWAMFFFVVILAYLPLRPSKFFHDNKLWDLWFRHLKISVVGPKNTQELSRRQQIYAVIPHGLFPFGLAFAAIGPIRKLLQIKRIVAASATQYIPLLRHVIGWIGGVEATPRAVETSLENGESLAVCPGGIAEMFWGVPRPGCLPHEEFALLLNRKGFVRLALKHGLPLVPVYVFGNTKLFKRVPLPQFIEKLSLLFRISLVLFWGRLGLPIPFPVPLLYAIGAPIEDHLSHGRRNNRKVDGAPAAATNSSDGPCWVGPGWSPSDEEVDQLHKAFCNALLKLFDEHKGPYGWPNKSLRLV